MRLRVLLPSEVLVDEDVTKVVAEAANGSFCLLPRHIDFATALAPGILLYIAIDSQEHFVAVDEGILVKCGSKVSVSTRTALTGTELGALRQALEGKFRVLDEHERLTRAALARLEADFVHRFVELRRHDYA